jgi:hypothetical protein
MLEQHDQKKCAAPIGGCDSNNKVNSMKTTILTAAILFSLSGPVSVRAELPAVAESLTEVGASAAEPGDQQASVEALSGVAVTTAGSVELQDVSATPAEAASSVAPGKPCPMHGMGKMRTGMGHDGKAQGGGKPGCDHGGRGQQGKHEQVVRRLDMIEARLAKIEVMLESLMQR